MVRRSAIAFVLALVCSTSHWHDTGRHFIMWDDPEWFFREVDAFVTDPPARAQSRGF